jgi:hypothetical protein
MIRKIKRIWKTTKGKVTFLEVTKGKMQGKNEHSIQINMPFTPRTQGYG